MFLQNSLQIKIYQLHLCRVNLQNNGNKPFPIPPAAPYSGHRIAVPNPQGDEKEDCGKKVEKFLKSQATKLTFLLS